MPWADALRGDPLPWLLEEADAAVRAATLQRLLGRPADDAQVVAARRAALQQDPIRSMLAAQHPEGWWVKPGPGYAPKYTGTVWQLIFLDQLGADPADPRITRACEYVLATTATERGGFGSSGVAQERRPPPSSVVHCLNGNLLRALIGFGHLDHPTVQAALDWAASTVTGEGDPTYYRSGTTGPGFACTANEALPCAWGGVKELLAFARVPAERRSPRLRRAVAAGVDLLLSVDPATADYPRGYGNAAPSRSWFAFGFPSGYVADVLQALEALAELGHAGDPRLATAVDLVLSQQDVQGRWRNRHAYHRKTTVDIERQGQPSKWVTLRACGVLKARADALVAPGTA